MTPTKIAATIALLDYYRRFLRSEKAEAVDPESSRTHSTITRGTARARLRYLVNVAINRRAARHARLRARSGRNAHRCCWPQGVATFERARRDSDGRQDWQQRQSWALNGRPTLVAVGLAPLNHRSEVVRAYEVDEETSMRRDARRLKGYGGFGLVLESRRVRERTGADHVHHYVDGSTQLCRDRECESRY